jgi:molecular chaperone DnaJ
VYVNIWTPQALNSDEKSMLEKLQKSENFEPHPDKSEKGFFERIKEMFS